MGALTGKMLDLVDPTKKRSINNISFARDQVEGGEQGTW